MTRVLAKEVAPFNIRTLTVVLGTFKTDMGVNATFSNESLPDDYKGTMVEKMMQVISSGNFDHFANSDANKGMQAVYDVVTGENAGAGHETEKLLPLGADMTVRIKIVQDYLAHALEAFADVTNSVGLD
jgi:hypothetical protein